MHSWMRWTALLYPRAGLLRFGGNWCGQGGCVRTDHPREVIEAALAHLVQNKVEAACAWSDLFERRRLLMDEWAVWSRGNPSSMLNDLWKTAWTGRYVTALQ